MMSFPIMAPRIPRRTGVAACRMAIHRGGVGLAVVVCSSMVAGFGACVCSVSASVGLVVWGSLSLVVVWVVVRWFGWALVSVVVRGWLGGGGGCVFLGLAG